MDKDTLIQAWKDIIIGDGKSWVIFKNGTAVIFVNDNEGLEEKALKILAEWGPVHAGGPAGDFSTIVLPDDKGWIVTCHHNDILTYVAPDEVDEDTEDFVIGILGRSKRDLDAEQLEIVHIELY